MENTAFEAEDTQSRERCSLWNPAQRWPFCFPPVHWFQKLVPARFRWCELYTWVNTPCPPFWELHSAASICCSDNAHILNILLSAHSQSGLPAPGKQPHSLKATSWVEEFGQTEDTSPREKRKGRKLPAEASGEDHVCVLRVPRGHRDQRPAPECLCRGWVGLKCGHSESGAEVSRRRCFAFSLKTNWTFLAWSADNPPLWVTSRKLRYTGICLQLSSTSSFAHHSCYFQDAPASFSWQLLPFSVPAFQQLISS